MKTRSIQNRNRNDIRKRTIQTNMNKPQKKEVNELVNTVLDYLK